MKTVVDIALLLALGATGLVWWCGLPADRPAALTEATAVRQSMRSELDQQGPTPSAARAEAQYPLARTIRYRYTVTNPGFSSIRQPEFWVAVPLARTSSQRLVALDASLPYRFESSDHGRQSLAMVIGVAQRFGTPIVGLEVRMN